MKNEFYSATINLIIGQGFKDAATGHDYGNVSKRLTGSECQPFLC